MATINESMLWVKKQSPKRLANAFQIWKSYHQSKSAAFPKINGLPLGISIEPTTSCNLRCPECPSGLRSFTRPTGMLSENIFEQVIDQLAPVLTNLTFYFQGEPYLNPKFLNMVKYASERKVFTSTSTNAHYLTEETSKRTIESGLDRLIISIDGVSQETYEQYRVGGQLSKVLEGTRNILNWKKKLKSRSPHVVFQFLVVKPNENDIPRLYRLAKELDVDEVKLKTAQIYDYRNGSDLIPDNPKYARYKKEGDGTYSIKNPFDNQCWKMWSSSVITWDGKVVPCCFDKDASHVMGDLNAETFSDIWFGPRYHSFRKSILKARSEIEICKNCSEGLKVWA
jgi:radical SAM protein with 4Fe4S-binding SPASM domain